MTAIEKKQDTDNAYFDKEKAAKKIRSDFKLESLEKHIINLILSYCIENNIDITNLDFRSFGNKYIEQNDEWYFNFYENLLELDLNQDAIDIKIGFANLYKNWHNTFENNIAEK